MFAAQRITDGFEHFHAAVGGAGPKAGLAHHESPCAGHVKTIDVFGGRYGLNHLLPIDVLRQRQLHQYAVNGGV